MEFNYCLAFYLLEIWYLKEYYEELQAKIINCESVGANTSLTLRETKLLYSFGKKKSFPMSKQAYLWPNFSCSQVGLFAKWTG